MHYAEHEIGMRWTDVTRVENRSLGYDPEADDEADLRMAASTCHRTRPRLRAHTGSRSMCRQTRLDTCRPGTHEYVRHIPKSVIVLSYGR
jgi:hypothetical protein